MKKKKLGEMPELQDQLRKMNIPESTIQEEADAEVIEFDLGNKGDRSQVRKDMLGAIAKNDGTIIGDVFPPE